jgi:glycosyltransferase involved in cell wall biosynthesis
VPVGDSEAQATALRDLANDPARRTERSRAGLAAAGRLSWTATARGTVDVYRSLGVTPSRIA